MNLTNILKKAIITEKSLKNAGSGVFTFEVDTHASKDQISSAVQQAFNVNVIKVTTIHITPKKYRTGKKRQLKLTTPGKKALVKLKSGQKIDLFDIDTNN